MIDWCNWGPVHEWDLLRMLVFGMYTMFHCILRWEVMLCALGLGYVPYRRVRGSLIWKLFGVDLLRQCL